MIEDDEIAVIAKVTMSLGDRWEQVIDGNIADAARASEWDQMNKWYRVRLRIIRFRREMDQTART
ncbi:MAG: hypothetical protein ABIS51_04875 [Sphingomonas sp.]